MEANPHPRWGHTALVPTADPKRSSPPSSQLGFYLGSIISTEFAANSVALSPVGSVTPLAALGDPVVSRVGAWTPSTPLPHPRSASRGLCCSRILPGEQNASSVKKPKGGEEEPPADASPLQPPPAVNEFWGKAAPRMLPGTGTRVAAASLCSSSCISTGIFILRQTHS